MDSKELLLEIKELFTKIDKEPNPKKREEMLFSFIDKKKKMLENSLDLNKWYILQAFIIGYQTGLREALLLDPNETKG